MNYNGGWPAPTQPNGYQMPQLQNSSNPGTPAQQPGILHGQDGMSMPGMSPRFPQPMGYSDFDMYGMRSYAHLTGGWPPFIGQQSMLSTPQAQFPMPSGHPFTAMNPWVFPQTRSAVPNQQMMNEFNQQLASQPSQPMTYTNAPMADMSSIDITSGAQSEANAVVSSTLNSSQMVQPRVLIQAPQPRLSSRQEQFTSSSESIAPKPVKTTPSAQGRETPNNIHSRDSVSISKQQTSQTAPRSQRNILAKAVVTSSKDAVRSTASAAKKRQNAESTRRDSVSAVQRTKKRISEEQPASSTPPKRQKPTTTINTSLGKRERPVGRIHEVTNRGQDGVDSDDISAAKNEQTALVKVESIPSSLLETTPSSVTLNGKPALKNNRRVCDECVKRRTRCSFAQEKRPKGADITNTGLTCEQCQASSKSCNTTKPKKKRGPEDGWALAPRLLEMLRRDDEQLLYRWCSSVLLNNHLVGDGASGDNFDYLVSTRAVQLSGEWKKCQLTEAIRTKTKKRLPGTETTLVKDEFVGEGAVTRMTKTPDRREPGYRLATDLIDRRQRGAAEDIRRQEIGAELQIINNFNAKCARMQQDGMISKLIESQPVSDTMATISGTVSNTSAVLLAGPTTLASFAPIEAEQTGRVEELEEPAVLNDSILDHTATRVDQVLPTTQEDQSTPQPPGCLEAIRFLTPDIPDQVTTQQEDLSLDQPLTAEDFAFDPNDIADIDFGDLFGPEFDTKEFDFGITDTDNPLGVGLGLGIETEEDMTTVPAAAGPASPTTVKEATDGATAGEDLFSDASLLAASWDEGLDLENLDYEA